MTVHGRAVSMKDVARHAGVSVTTVSNVLNGTNRLSASTRQRVLDSVKTLGYVRNSAAHQLRKGHSNTVGLILSDASNPFYSAIARGAEDAAIAGGGSVILGNSGGSIEREQHYLKLFEEHRVRGLIIAPVADQTTRIGELKNRGISSVIVGRGASPAVCSSVTVDNLSGGYIATQHLVETGKNRLAFVGPPEVRGVKERLEGMRGALADHKLPGPEVVDSGGLGVSAGRDVGLRLIERGLSDMPDGIFCANDLLALGLLHALVITGHVRIPQDVALLGYDDIDFAATAILPLSSIRQPSELIGRTAIELLDREQHHHAQHRQIMFPPELVVRETTRR